MLKKKREKNKMEEERKKEKKAPQKCKSPTKGFITTIKSLSEYTHIHIHL